jgi:hypothetical protein
MKTRYLLITLCTLLFAGSLAAQFGREEDRRETYRFTDQLWYGGSFVIGYSGGTFESLFQIGISPMIGYKLTPNFSFGPRFSYVYSHYRQRIGNDVDKFNYGTYALGIFSRYKVIPAVFAHLEWSYQSDVVGFNINDEPIRRNRGIPYIGLGYLSGGGERRTGYEILALYNLNAEDNLVQGPFSFRVGFTYNF